MLIKSIKYCYVDVAIIPTVTSCVEHRKQCKPYDENGFLPIFTAPMSSVINSENFELFEKNSIKLSKVIDTLTPERVKIPFGSTLVNA